ncbi:hypothetical protein CEXT_109451 [Caerostris extrusa]|uniref:Uncharacterized protein n=1 Tax=Caerostris extrusa TaxID=172846 RepID=A0AAV4WRI2_CAEEX|nr:hypothetical protein CEXT_109451 [Caerostris extrusa]
MRVGVGLMRNFPSTNRATVAVGRPRGRRSFQDYDVCDTICRCPLPIPLRTSCHPEDARTMEKRAHMSRSHSDVRFQWISSHSTQYRNCDI